jgi:uncharacterized protein YjbI with pentapeptide repeats
MIRPEETPTNTSEANSLARRIRRSSLLKEVGRYVALMAMTALVINYLYDYLPQWLIKALLVVGAGGIAVWGVRWLLDSGARRMAGGLAPLSREEHDELTPKDRLELTNVARQSILQVATAVGAVLAATFTAGGLIYTARTLDTTQQAQITERYTRAIDQLGSTKVDVRLGGIYAIERLAYDSPSDAPAIANVLAAYIRVHSNSGPDPRRHPSLEGQSGASLKVGQYEISADVQAALEVLRKREINSAAGQVDLHGARLPGIILDIGDDLSGADLREAFIDSDADFSHANMEKAHFTKDDMGFAQFTRTDLQGADFLGTDLTHADLREADLRKVYMENAKLADAWMNGANLQGAHLENVSFQGADLSKADLRGVDLSKTTGLTRAQISKAITDSKTRLPSGLG